MNRRTVMLGAAGLLGSTCLAARARAAGGIKIGFSGAMSGAIGVTGTQALGGVQVALEQLGGRLGGVPATVLVEDDQSKPEIARQVAEKLILQDKVDVLIAATTSNALLSMYQPVIQARKILISVVAGPSQIAGKECSPYFFNTSWQGDDFAEAMGQYLTGKGIEGVYLMAPNYAAGHDVIAGFKRYYKGRIAGEKFTPLSQMDFSAELTQLRAVKPAAVFAFYPGGLGIQFLKQYANYGLKDALPLYTSYTIDNASLPALGSSALGYVLTTFWSSEMDNAANRRLIDGYRRKFGYVPAFYAAQSYDAINMLNAAVATLGGDVADPDRFADAIFHAKFDSARGSFRFANDHFPIQDYYLATVKAGADGKPRIVLGEMVMKDHGNAYQDLCPMK